MEPELEDWEKSKENVLPLKTGRKLSTLQAASDDRMKEQLALQKRVFETELRLYSGDDELEIWFRYVQWIEQNFPKGGQDGNLPVLLKQCLNRFMKSPKYKDDERYINCWLKFIRYSTSTLEVFTQMDALEIGHKCASFYEAWAWHLAQLGNFRKANKILQEGIDNNAQPIRILRDAQAQLNRKLIQQYSCNEEIDQPDAQRVALGGLKTIGKKHLAPVSRVGVSKVDEHITLPVGQKLSKTHATGRLQIFQDSENIPPTNRKLHIYQDSENSAPVTQKSQPTTLTLNIHDSENQMAAKPWNKVKCKSSSSNSNVLQEKPKFTIHEDNNETEGTGRKLVNAFTTVFRGSQPEKKFGFFEAEDPGKFYVCDIQKLYGGAEEFQAEEIAAARWFKKQQEQELNKLKEQIKLAASFPKVDQNVENNVQSDQQASCSSQNSHPISAETKLSSQCAKFSTTVESSSPTRDVIDLWNGTLSHRSREENLSVSGSSINYSSSKSVQKPIFQIYVDDQGPDSLKSKPQKPNPELCHDANKNNDIENNFMDNCKENNAPADVFQDVNDKASAHNILQPTDRPIPFGAPEDEDSCEDDVDLGVRPLQDEDGCDTVGPLTSQIHFMMGPKYSSTPFHSSKASKIDSCGTQKHQELKPSVGEFKTPGVSIKEKGLLSPITEASVEASKSSATSSSASSTSGYTTQRMMSSGKSLICQTTYFKGSLVDPYDPDLLSMLLLSVGIENRKGFVRIQESLPKQLKQKELKFGNHEIRVTSMLAEGGEGMIFRAEYNSGQEMNKELVLKVYRPSNFWEFYISSEVDARISSVSRIPDVRESLPSVFLAPVYDNCNVLVSDFCNHGTLLDLANAYRSQRESIPEDLILYITWEMLQIVNTLHSCHLVHGDIKPDNFLVLSLPTNPQEMTFSKTFCLRLIDFGRAVDLNLFPKGTTFSGASKTENFVCPEMIENKPWVFQPDYFGILGTIHTLLFPEYMNIIKNNGAWEIKNKFKRYWQIAFWHKLFNMFLNVPDCEHFPDLSVFIKELEQKLSSSKQTMFLKKNTCMFLNILKSKKKV